MNSISEKTIEEFAIWAKKNEDKNIFPLISADEDSYYIKRESDDTYIMKYSIETLMELRQALEVHGGLSDSPEMLKMLTVEVCQDRYKSTLRANKEDKRKKAYKGEKALPEYVYVF